MKVMNLSQKQFNNLVRLSLPKEVTNTESEIYILDRKNGHDSLLLKKLFVTNGSSMANKLYNISLLGDNKDEIGIEELVVPKHLVSIKHQISAFTVPKIDGINLGVILKDTKISNEKKLEYLYKVGQLLRKTRDLKVQGMRFNFGDFHEYNLIVGKDEKTYAVDLDSCYLDTANPQPSYYLSTNKNLSYFPVKYKTTKTGIVYPNNNSDLLCYNMMILNTIGRDKVSKFDISTYFEYVSYLKSLGFGKDIIHSFQNVYSSAKNINPYEYLDQIPIDSIGEAGVSVFQYKKKIGKI